MIDPQFFVLPDKRTLCYAQYGDQEGFPLLYCHGFPSSRLEAGLAQAEALRLGIRLISIDRPGFGGSDFLPDRTILGWSDDVRTLLTHLHIKKFSVLGVSGGAPYAMSCAVHLNEHVIKLGIVCGLGWLGDKYKIKQMHKSLRLMISLFQTFPRAGSGVVQQLIVPLLKRYPAFVFNMTKALVSSDDRQLLNDPRLGWLIQESLKEAFRQGSKGPAQEFVLYCMPWEFDLRRINAETYLWHGDHDYTVPLSMGEHHAELIPLARMKVYPGEGHFTVPIRHMGEILQTLCVEKP